MAREVKHAYYKAVGHNSHDVTGSANLIRFGKYTILLDYGMYQTNDTLGDYKVNKVRHKDIKPKEIDYIFLSHIHNDHCGLLPTLYKDGCTAPILTPVKSKLLLKLMLLDSVNIMEKDCERYNKRHDVSMVPLFDENDVYNTLKYVVECPFGQDIITNQAFKFRFLPANHIVNAAQIILELHDGNVIRKVGYTGDIGSPTTKKLFTNEFEPIQQVDLLIGECTYSNSTRVHKKKDRAKDIEKIKTVVAEAIRDHGKVLIPVFSLNRLEDMVSVLYDIYHEEGLKIPVIVDTPLGQNIAKIWHQSIDKDIDYWNEVWHWENLQKPESYKESKAWQDTSGPMIIVSSGGMLTAGRAVGWAQHLLPHGNNHIVFCGFSSEKSLASQIKNYKANPYVKVDGTPIKNKAQVTIMNSFSSHADHDELLKYYTDVQYNKIALVHSEQDSKNNFAEELKEALSKANRTSRVISVNQDTKIMI